LFLESALLEIVDLCSRRAEILDAAVKRAQTRSSADVAVWRQDMEKVNDNADWDQSADEELCSRGAMGWALMRLKDELQAEGLALAAEKQRQLVVRERLTQRLQASNLELANLAGLRSDLQYFVTAFSDGDPGSSD